MKKLFASLAILCAFVCIVSCSSGASPKAIAEQYAEFVKQGDYTGVVNLLYIQSTGDATQDKEQKEVLIDMFNQNIKPEIEAKGGVKSYSISKIIMDEDKESAITYVDFIFNNGTLNKQKCDLVKVDNKWYLTFKK
ncbi:MAG: DUF4878 domain-containing protein [Rikenellaceae bacterium]